MVKGTSSIVHLPSYIFHLTSYIIHLPSYILHQYHFCPIFVYYYAIKCRNIVVTLQSKTNPTYREYKI